jgi:hypothetical protein
MKRLMAVLLLGLAQLFVLIPALKAEIASPEVLIGRARAVALSPHFSREEVTKAMIDALDASLLILPQADYAAELKSRVATVREMFAKGAIFEDKARQYLGLAYKLVSDGQAWAVPEELKSKYRDAEITDPAKKICVALLDESLVELKAGRPEAAVRGLISFVIFVITPVEA